MPLDKCPGQDKRFWTARDIYEVKCPSCDTTIEFWKDDVRRKCPSCKKEVFNPKLDLSCALWCQQADICLDGLTLEEKLISEVYKAFGSDRKRIQHALRTFDYARMILKAEGGNPLVVSATALLHDIGIIDAEKKHGSAAPEFQQKEGPPLAREILKRHNVEPDVINSICDIISHHHQKEKMTSPEGKVIWDADSIVNILEDREKSKDIPTGAEEELFTAQGKKLLHELLSDES